MIVRVTASLHRLRRDPRGAAIVEFAIVAPVMCLLLLAAFDVSHSLYTRAVLQGMVQKIARDSTIETADSTATGLALDARVRNQVSAMFKTADIDIKRRFYRTFSEAAAARAETFTDTNGNLRCDANELYQDANNNSTWDKDGGNEGQGGAKDATLYTVTVSYPKLMPVTKLIGGSDRTNITAQTVLRNQPYGDQATYAAPTLRNCS